MLAYWLGRVDICEPCNWLERFSKKTSPIAEYALGLKNSDSRSFSILAFATTLIAFTDVPQFKEGIKQVPLQKPIS